MELRPRVTPDEYALIINHRALVKECLAKGIPVEDVKHYWHKSKDFSLFVKTEKNVSNVVAELIEKVREYAPKYPVIKYPKKSEGHLLVIDPADIHLGKLCTAFETGEDYNIDIAKQRLMEGIKGILQKTAGFHIDQILFVSGNDKLHVDTPKNTTTSGTAQDTHLMWYDAFRMAIEIEKEALELLLPVAPVFYQYDPSNHDYTNGFFMAQTIEAWFSKTKGIKFNTSISHRKYYEYHSNLIGTTHGDGAKETDLPLLMAHEAGAAWSRCKHKYVYTHHLHHKRSRDYMGVCVETLRSASGTDSWHHRNGYQHAPKAIEGFLHHKEHGQIARITHIF